MNRTRILGALGLCCAMLPGIVVPEPAGASADRWVQHSAESVSGSRIAYYTAQDSADTLPLLVIAGGPGSDHRYMHAAGTFRALAGKRRVVMYDQRATGSSTTAPSDPGIDLWIEDIDAVRRALGVGQVDLMGHSWGGYLALTYAASHPERVRRIILVDSAAPELSGNIQLLDKAYPKRSEKWRALRSKLPNQFDAEEIALFFSMEFLDPEWYERYLDHVRGLAYDISVNNALREDLAERDLASRLATVLQPTLVLHGRFDMVLATETSWNIHQALSNSTFHVFEESGHMPFVEQRDEFIRIVADFLSDLK